MRSEVSKNRKTEVGKRSWEGAKRREKRKRRTRKEFRNKTGRKLWRIRRGTWI